MKNTELSAELSRDNAMKDTELSIKLNETHNSM